MVAHRSNDSCLCCLSHFLAEHDGEVEIVALGLLPNIMRSVISGPDNQIRVDRRNFLQEQLEALDRKVT